MNVGINKIFQLFNDFSKTFLNYSRNTILREKADRFTFVRQINSVIRTCFEMEAVKVASGLCAGSDPGLGSVRNTPIHLVLKIQQGVLKVKGFDLESSKDFLKIYTR